MRARDFDSDGEIQSSMENTAAISKAVGIPVELVGADLDGMQFIETAVTQTITRDGATIALESSLGPDSELILRVGGKGEESLARVVGTIRREEKRYVYAIAIMRSSPDVWRESFPAPARSGTVYLQCRTCKTTVDVPLLDIELVVLQTKSELPRQCATCRTLTTWMETDQLAGLAPPALTPSVPAAKSDPAVPAAANAPASEMQKTPGGKERRASRRVAMKSFACIRYGGTETQVACEDMSRSGFRFRSSRQFAEDLRVEAAVPFNKSGTNIFMQARIIYSRKLESGEYRHGVAYTETKHSPRSNG